MFWFSIYIYIQLYVSSSPTQFFHENSPFLDLDIGEISCSSSRPCWNPASRGCTRAPSWSSLGHYIRMVPFPITLGNEEFFCCFFQHPGTQKKVRFLLVTAILRGGGPIESTPGSMVFFCVFFYHELARIFPSTFKVGSEPKKTGCLDRVGGMRFYLK